MQKEKILLAGATGYLGKYIAQRLMEKNYSTRLIVRNKSKEIFSETKFDIVEAHITNPMTLNGCCEGIDTIISTVGITRQKDGLSYMDVDYQANMNLLEKALKAGVKKFIYVSALNADKLKHLKMCEAKEKFVDELKQSGIDYCIVRPNGFFSDMTEFLKMAKKGTINLFGDGTLKMNPIHGEDLAKVCVDAIHSSVNKIEVGGPELLTHNEIAELACETMGKKTKIKYMPEGMRKMILWVARTFTSSKTYGPMEFFFTVLSMNMVAPTYGGYTLKRFYEEEYLKL
jgi:uncharacterized protein YbjT (DUF2867 family)